MKSDAIQGIDARVGGYLVEVKAGIQSVRSLRDAIIHLAYRLADQPSGKALLVLPCLQLTQGRLKQEQEKAQKAFRPEIMDRLNMILVEEGEYRNLPPRFSLLARACLDRLVQKETARHGERLPRMDGHYAILKLLVLQWLKNDGPMTAKWLSAKTGYSYPTVAKALARLADGIKRHSDRRFELNSFPREEWARLLAVADSVRSTTFFVDSSGQPRPVDALLRRLRELGRADIATGGVYGARHYHPALDLVGSPRLDLTVHCPNDVLDLGFVERLDPGLEREEGSGKRARLAVHVVRGPESFFESGADGLSWADPVECLLDLHEAHLESQALDFLNALSARRKQTP